jgi:transcriptional adapter 2-alpha
LDVTGKPSVDLLSDKERDLCSALRLYPEQYLVIKETMIREFLKSNMLNKAHITKIVKIGTNPFHTIEDAGYLKLLIHVVFRPC